MLFAEAGRLTQWLACLSHSAACASGVQGLWFRSSQHHQHVLHYATWENHSDRRLHNISPCDAMYCVVLDGVSTESTLEHLHCTALHCSPVKLLVQAELHMFHSLLPTA